MKYNGKISHRPRNKWLVFGADPETRISWTTVLSGKKITWQMYLMKIYFDAHLDPYSSIHSVTIPDCVQGDRRPEPTLTDIGWECNLSITGLTHIETSKLSLTPTSSFQFTCPACRCSTGGSWSTCKLHRQRPLSDSNPGHYSSEVITLWRPGGDSIFNISSF